jgi:hypothetical protein
MKKILFVNLVFAFSFALFSCGPSQAELLAQTSVAETAIVASWTDTPTSTPSLTPTETETPTLTPTPTPTPDPCAPENLVAAVQEIDDLQIRFDDLSLLASNLPRDKVSAKITEMQELLQTATDQKAAPCLDALKEHQLKHMSFVIDTLIAFIGGADQQELRTGINQAGEEHRQYVAELTSLLGITPTPAP